MQIRSRKTWFSDAGLSAMAPLNQLNSQRKKIRTTCDARHVRAQGRTLSSSITKSTAVGRQAGETTMLNQSTGETIASFHSWIPARAYEVTSSPLTAQIEPAGNAVYMSLTARQRDVLAVMMQGKTNKAICRILNLAEPTVKNHVTAILKALNVTNRTEAVIKVARAAAASMSYAYTISGRSTFVRD
jgi:DNA-binding NarL/FixJ family response regulator